MNHIIDVTINTSLSVEQVDAVKTAYAIKFDCTPDDITDEMLSNYFSNIARVDIVRAEKQAAAESVTPTAF